MELINCIPYIRFANTLCFTKQRTPSKTYDCRFLYTFEGAAVIYVKGEQYVMQNGTLVLFQPDTEYSFIPNPSVTFAVFDFDYTQNYSNTTDYLIPCSLHAFLPENAHEKISFTDAAILNQPFYQKNMQFLEYEINGIITEFQQKNMYFHEKNSTQFKNLLIDLIRHQQLGTPGNNIVKMLIQYIDQHTTERISNTKIGMDLNYNPNYLNCLMLRHTGMSLHQYVLQKRLNYAITLLQTTNRSINDIAMDLGFNSLSHFSNYFKKETGTTPMIYRRSGML